MATACLSGRVFKSSTASFTHSGTTVSTRPLKYRDYTQSHLEQACKAVREGLSVRRAAEEYQIPKSTIQDHISGKVLSGSKSGQRYLSEQEEEELVTFILEAAKIGFTRTRKDIMSLVQTTVNAKGKNVTISSGWWDGFKKRHPQVSLRMAEHNTGSIPIPFAGTDSTVPVEYTTCMYLVPQRKSEHVAVTSKSTVLSKCIGQEKSQAVFKVPVIPPKSCGKILTSEENRKAMEEKEMKKQEELRKKEERKEKRNQARIQKLSKQATSSKRKAASTQASSSNDLDYSLSTFFEVAQSQEDHFSSDSFVEGTETPLQRRATCTTSTVSFGNSALTRSKGAINSSSVATSNSALTRSKGAINSSSVATSNSALTRTKGAINSSSGDFSTLSCFKNTVKPSTAELEQYCICKREEFGRMIFCENEACSIGWWHYSCADIKRKPRGSWYCPLCIKQK